MTPSKHLFKLSGTTPDEHTEGGMRIRASKANFPILNGMSLYKLILHPQGVREPHWHANADELGYCLKGQVVVNLYHTGDTRERFLVEAGDAFLIPSGALHAIENVAENSAELLLNFSHEEPEDFSLSAALGAFSNAVLGNTWHVASDHFNNWQRSPTKSSFATLLRETPTVHDDARYMTPYRYGLKKSQPILTCDGGSARMARQNVWPIVKRQALYSLILTDRGMREPHWHPETAELGYVEMGHGRMSIMDPTGNVDTYLIEEGDIYFIPKAYPHHIENLGPGDLKLQIFFDGAMPKDIGFTASVRANSDEVLASTTMSPLSLFASLPKYYADLFIVDRINPLDP